MRAAVPRLLSIFLAALALAAILTVASGCATGTTADLGGGFNDSGPVDAAPPLDANAEHMGADVKAGPPSSDTGADRAASDTGKGDAATYTVGGHVKGLVGSGLVLEDNGSDMRAVSKDGAFTFAASVPTGGAYAVTVLTPPSAPSQTCAITNGAGTIAASDVTNVLVDCTGDAGNVDDAPATFTIGGTVSGLVGSVVLQDNGGDDLTVSTNGGFTFLTSVVDGGPYSVTVLTQPAGPSQTCLVSLGSGAVSGADVTSVVVACTTDVFTVGGTVSGLTGAGLVLEDNGGDDLPVASDGAFTFPTPVASGDGYVVTVSAEPSTPTQVCAVTSGSGVVTTGPITSVSVTCTTSSFTVGGTVSGLAAGDSVVLQDNLSDNLTVASNGAFTFPTPLASGATYSATVLTQPSSPPEICVVTSGSGTVGGADVTSVVVTCSTTGTTCGRFTSGVSGTWSKAAPNPEAKGMGLSGYLPSGGATTLYLLRQGAFEEYLTASNSYFSLAAPPVAFSLYPSAAWYSDAIWVFSPKDLLRYDVASSTWTTAATGLTVAADSQTTGDDAGNLWTFESKTTLLEYSASSSTSSKHGLSTAIGTEGRISYDACSGLLYLTSYKASSLFSYDPSSGTQKKLASLPGGRAFQDAFCGDHSGHLFALIDGSILYQYDITTNSWSTTPSGPIGRLNSSCGVGADGFLYATDPSASAAMWRIQLK